MTYPTETLVDQVKNALRVVIDPELGDNVVELGLVYSVAVEDGGVARIVMTTTTRGCPATAFLRDGVRDGAWTIPGIEFVDVALTYEPLWSPQMMTEEARRRLGIADGGEW